MIQNINFQKWTRTAGSLSRIVAFVLAGLCTRPACAEPLEEAAALLGPYRGPVNSEVNPEGLAGKVFTGYQGWFNAPGDGSARGFIHWSKDPHQLSPISARIDLWPDMSEYGEGERYHTDFQNADGSPATVFSSINRDTVMRHFRWMRDYGIDGAFLQRFPNELADPKAIHHRNQVLLHVREGANTHGRVWSLMYDLTGLKAGQTERVKRDWSLLREHAKITEDPAWIRHQGKPLVAIWGVGFNDNRSYNLEECADLIRFFKSEGCAVLVGIPTWWREQKGDAVSDPALHDILKAADILSPWTVGRFGSPDEARDHGENHFKPDAEWARKANVSYLPVVFPGFSWSNMHGKEIPPIPRLKGAFFWSQIRAVKAAGLDAVYVAMFDEVDEATAVFKIADPPVAPDLWFQSTEGLPADFYLKLCGAAGKALRGEIPLTDEVPLPTKEE